MKQGILAGAAILLVIGSLACMTSCRDRQSDEESSSATAQASPSGRTSQSSSSSNDPVKRGETAYFAHCVVCHSPDTEESPNGPTMKAYFRRPPTKLADGRLFPRTDDAVRELIEKGTSNMPPLSKGMTTQEIEDILAYLHTL